MTEAKKLPGTDFTGAAYGAAPVILSPTGKVGEANPTIIREFVYRPLACKISYK